MKAEVNLMLVSLDDVTLKKLGFMSDHAKL